jgi:ribonuclease HI
MITKRKHNRQLAVSKWTEEAIFQREMRDRELIIRDGFFNVSHTRMGLPLPIGRPIVRLFTQMESNPGYGAYAFTVTVNRITLEYQSQALAQITQYQLELTALSDALWFLERGRVIIQTTRSNVVSALQNGSARRWLDAGLRLRNGKLRANAALWEVLFKSMEGLDATFEVISKTAIEFRDCSHMARVALQELQADERLKK